MHLVLCSVWPLTLTVWCIKLYIQLTFTVRKQHKVIQDFRITDSIHCQTPTIKCRNISRLHSFLQTCRQLTALQQTAVWRCSCRHSQHLNLYVAQRLVKPQSLQVMAKSSLRHYSTVSYVFLSNFLITHWNALGTIIDMLPTSSHQWLLANERLVHFRHKNQLCFFMMVCSGMG